MASVFILALIGLAVSGGVVDQAVPDPVNMAGIRESETREFLFQLQDAVRRNDRDSIAGMIQFPALMTVGAESKTVVNAKEFLASYDRIMTSELKSVILEQTAEELFNNYSGVRIGLGAVWFAGICRDGECTSYDVRIITINGVHARNSE